MNEEQIEIPLADGTTEAFLYREETERRPGVLFLTDIVGIRAANREMARRLAGEGYSVLMPNLFLLRARGRGSQHAGGGDPEARPGARGVGR